MEESSSSEANRLSVNKFHNILLDLMLHHCAHNRLLLIPLLSHTSPDHAMACQSSFFKIHANFILLLTTDSDPKNACFLSWKE